MDLRDFGATGLSVTPLGFGAMQIGDPAIDDRDAGRLLNQVLDLGVGLIDTARSYGLSEDRIGRHLSRRRDEFLLSTKLGYGVDGCEDWTYECVSRGVDRALAVLRTDRIDVAHLHSCPGGVLSSNGVLDALAAAREQGKVLCAAYSGDNDALSVAVESGLIQSVQASVSLFDQANLRRRLPAAADAGLAVIGKRTLGAAPWRGRTDLAPPEAEYRRRYEAMAASLPAAPEMAGIALRFAAFAPGVTCVLVGGTRIEHLQDNIAAVERGPLPASSVARIDEVWAHCGAEWDSIV
jgi:aryl-alcohol dehydrogenase-like predicted oxidoreductase